MMQSQKDFLNKGLRFSALMGAIVLTIMLIDAVSGYQLDITVVDYNTYQVIGNATVKVYNNTQLLYEDNTSDLGMVQFNLSSGNYSLVTTKTEYEGDNRYIEIDGDTSELIRLIPYSREGIIRVTYTDLTFKPHELVFYYGSNERLEGIYNWTQVITLSQHESYHVDIKPTLYDLSNQPNNILAITSRYRSAIMFLIFLSVLVGLAYLIVKKVSK